MSLIAHLQSLTDDTLVLAATERVSRHIKMQSALLQSVAGKRTWFAKGKIRTVTQWLEEVWHDQLPNEQLLYPVQELAVVKSVADRSGLLPENLISSTSTARRIAQAYSTFIKFKLPDDPDRFRFKREYEVFWQWRALIKEDCRQSGCYFRADLPRLVLQIIKAGAIKPPRKIVLVGVLYMNPSEREVIDLLKSMGSDVVELDVAAEAVKPKLRRAVTQSDEFEHVAEWVNNALKPYIDTPHAAPAIAILVPDIEVYQAPLVEALSMTVSPASLLPAVDGAEVREPWDISSGATLGARPIIRAAMGILSITNRSADADVFSRVLRSHWVGGHAVEGAQRALADVWMRENNGLNMGGKDYLRALGACKTRCNIFTENLRRTLARQEEDGGSRYPSEWAEFFKESLSKMGWPEAETLSSANYQTLDAWEEALKVFRSLDYQLGPCPYERAYMWMREIVDTRQFQPRLSHVAPVAIMTYGDAVGLTFDHVWMLGATNKTLPLPADPNPFLPVDLLSDAGVPEATSDGQLAKAQRLVQALMTTSTDITVSSFEHDDRGSNIGASELFGSWPAPARCSAIWTGFKGNEVGHLNRDAYEEETVPAVDDEERKNLKGGVSVFQNYANEPFFAFACNRLGAREFPVPVIGFDPRIQGTMLHLCLELFWKEVKTQKSLKVMPAEQLDMTLFAAIEKASINLLYKLEWRYGRRMIKLEQARLKSLLLTWMEVEKARIQPFEVIGFERRTEVNVFGVELTVTLDRIDKIEVAENEFRTMLFDYKSGAKFTYTKLNASKLTEPQLPIYATQVEPKELAVPSIDGISLAQVNAKKMHIHTRSSFTSKLLGGAAGKNDVCMPGEWSEQMQAWNDTLEDMASGFLAGVGTLSSFDKALPMGYEHLEPLL
uniref:RecB family exonuclease n=1 Tax=Pseudomonas fluorescens (strain SBW25) TaxID=216595 RepID=A0A0G4E535_PSEFS|nr:PD-(D/E)XK nuclease family protein [Pseudomonas fluorescens]CEK42057.1 RecB family exonuclease [Pseudomonas fluorescens SBW25]